MVVPYRHLTQAPALSKKLKTQADRRRFRQGLKRVIEFVNYMNIKNLEDMLAAGDARALKLLTLDEDMKPSQTVSTNAK